MTAPDWSNCDPGDVVLETETETRCALATLVAIEALRHDGQTDWWDRSAAEILGHFDNLLACARVFADSQAALLRYIDQETDALHAAYMAKGPKACADPHGERLAELEAKEKRLAELEAAGVGDIGSA